MNHLISDPATPPAPRPDASGGTPRLDPNRAPIRVLDLELAQPASVKPAGRRTTDLSPTTGSVLALARVHGVPLGLVQVEADEPGDLLDRLTEAARTEFAEAWQRHLAEDEALGPGAADLPPCARRRLDLLADAPPMSVVVATRERPDSLARCLESLIRAPYPRMEIIVVDNAPATDRTEHLVRGRFADAVTYVREPRRGLASAHNRGLAEAGGRIIAFTDDDVVADPDWPAALAEGFAARDGVGCVTGLIVPAELETPAQIMLEVQGGFAKGFEQRYRRLGEPGAEPLFPFAAGKLGSGANMAFDAALLRGLGGFDRSTGTGTSARGGDDLLAFFRAAAAGAGMLYQPTAIVWHHHRRTVGDLERQVFGYGVGLGAYLAAAVVHEPQLIPALLRRLPRGLAHAVGQSRSARYVETEQPFRLSAAQRLGLLWGPFAYVKSRGESWKHDRVERAEAGT